MEIDGACLMCVRGETVIIMSGLNVNQEVIEDCLQSRYRYYHGGGDMVMLFRLFVTTPMTNPLLSHISKFKLINYMGDIPLIVFQL